MRDYGNAAQIGLESTPAEYVAEMVAVLREVRRALKDDGTLWLNLGDSYGNNKNLVGIPWRVAFALQDDGWYLRQDIIWSKPNPMPESVRDRCTRSHEYIFMFSKQPSYYYDQDAIKEPAIYHNIAGMDKTGFKNAAEVDGKHGAAAKNGTQRRDKQRGHGRRHAGFNDRWDAMEKSEQCSGMRNKRSVWNVATSPYEGAHFATFPPALIEPCILAGSRPGDTVLDPFGGSGTTGQVAESLGRQWLLIELNADYAKLADDRTRQTGMRLPKQTGLEIEQQA